MFTLPFLKSSNTKANKFISININSKDCRCLVFYPTDNSYKIIGYGKQELEAGDVRNGIIIDKENVIRATSNALMSALENLEDKTKDVIFGVGGNLSLGLMTTIRYKRHTKSIIGRDELNSIYSKLSESSYIQAENEYLQVTGNADVELENITSADVYLKVDDQHVPSIEGREGSVIEIAAYNAFAPTFHIRMLQDLAKKLGLNILAVGSENYTLAQWVKQCYTNTNDFVLINIGEDTTSVAVVFGGGIAATKNLDIGMMHFVESISEKMGVTTKEGQKLFKGYIDNKLTESESQVVQNILMDTLGIWLSGIELLFLEFSNVKIFPSKVFVGGNGAELKDLMQLLKNEPWTKSVPFKSFPEIIKFNLSDFNKVIDSTGKVAGSEWLTCISMSIIYDEIFKEDINK